MPATIFCPRECLCHSDGRQHQAGILHVGTMKSAFTSSPQILIPELLRWPYFNCFAQNAFLKFVNEKPLMVNQTTLLICGHFIEDLSKTLYIKGDAETSLVPWQMLPTPISACYFQYNFNATAIAHLGQIAHFLMKITLGPTCHRCCCFPWLATCLWLRFLRSTRTFFVAHSRMD